MKKALVLLFAVLFTFSNMYAADLTGSGYGSTRDESRANAVQDIKAQIIVEQESTTTIETYESDERSSDSFSVLITEYSRELPLLNIEYSDSEDPTAEFGMNWHTKAVIPSSSISLYQEQIGSLYDEIVDINNQIINDTSAEKNISWQETLLDLCYDYSNYSLIVSILSPSSDVPVLPVSMNRVRLEYEDMLNREKNSLETEIASMTLRLANGDLDAQDMKLLETYQERYLGLANDLGMLAGEGRDSVTFATMEYSSTDPQSASDYMLRIEANRSAFSYYRNSPINMNDRLVELATTAIDDLDTISRSEFTAVSNTDDLSIDVLSYNAQMGGWIARGNIMLGNQTLQFSFLVPYEDLVGSSYNDITFERWNDELMNNPDDIIRLTIGYTVRGQYIGNEYVFTINSLRIDRYTDSDGSTQTVRNMEDIQNPVTITFEYGTPVDLGDVEDSSIRKKTNEEVKGATNTRFYVQADVNGSFGIILNDKAFESIGGALSEEETASSDNSSAFDFGFTAGVSVEAGARFENDSEGKAKRYYGVGGRVSVSFVNGLMHYDSESGTDAAFADMSYSAAVNGYYMLPLDGTLDNFLTIYGGAGAGFGNGLSVFGDVGAGYTRMFNNHLELNLGITLNINYNEVFTIGVRPLIGVVYLF